MADETRVVEHDIVVKDAATGVLNRIAGAAGKVSSAFNRITNLTLAGGGLLGGLGFAKAVHDTDQLYQRVERVRAVTGMTAQNVHGMLSSFENAGLEMGAAEQIIGRLAQKSSLVQGSVTMTADQAGELAERFEKLGINMARGPYRTMLDMSKAAQKGALGIADLTRLFNVPASEAGRMMVMLQRGPDAIAKTMEATKGSAAVIDERALASFQKMQQARRELSSAWADMVGVLYKSLAPALTSILRAITDRVQSWGPAAEKFGKFLVDNMTTVVGLAKTMLVLMTANKALMMTGMEGLGGAMGAIWKKVRPDSIGLGKAGRIASMGARVDAAMAGPGSLAAGRLAIGNTLGKILPEMIRFTSLSKVFGPIIQGLLRLAPIGLVIMVIAKAIELVVRNVDGIRTRLGALFDRISAQFQVIAKSLTPVVHVLGVLLEGAARIALAIFEGIMEIASALLHLIMGIGIYMGKLIMHPVSTIRHPIDTFGEAMLSAEAETNKILHKREIDKAKAAADSAKPPDQRQPGVYQDFRGSRFDITQEFAEGFDPDRVAVAFQDELAEIGERGLQSGFSPLFSVR